MDKFLGRILSFFFLMGVICLTALIACSPNNETDGTADEAEVGAEYTPWSISSDCSTCHPTQSGSFEDITCIASAHESTCTDCHGSEIALEQVHANADSAPTRPSANSYTMANQETCLGECHASYDDLATRTAESKTLVDNNDLVINPHAVPSSSGHFDDSKECYNCHKIHNTQAPDGQYCRDCHHTNYFNTCTQCHD